jgi:NAD/NADP transhydrogenase beta subunit
VKRRAAPKDETRMVFGDAKRVVAEIVPTSLARVM